MRSPLLSIVGPTATGKTDFAFHLADLLQDQFHVFDIISADSRQVFQKMSIGTGADIPQHFELKQQDDSSLTKFEYPFFAAGRIRIHGVSIQLPTVDWSVTQFRDFSQNILQAAWRENNLPILVGGTGLYHSHLFTSDQQLEVPPNESVRAHAERISLADLQRWLETLNPEKLAAMNSSDRQNPRRLIRSIEVALAKEHQKEVTPAELPVSEVNQKVQQLVIGLTDSIELISDRIKKRIAYRLAHGMLDETQKLLADYDQKTWRLPAFSATGYKEVRAYLEDTLDYQQMQELWLRREVQYAKRQLTWWKKQPGVKWFIVSETGWQKKADEVVREWVASLSSEI